MKEIVCNIQPFDLTQTIYVIEDKKPVYISKVETKDFVNNAFSLWSSWGADLIRLIGHKKYALGLKQQIEKVAKTAYRNNEIKIVLSKR